MWLDAGKPDALLATNRYLLAHGRDNADDIDGLKGSRITGPVFIHPGADVKDSQIGPHVSIGPDATISRAKISNSIIDAGTTISDSTLTGSLIGRNARVRGVSGTINIGDNADVDCPN